MNILNESPFKSTTNLGKAGRKNPKKKKKNDVRCCGGLDYRDGKKKSTNHARRVRAGPGSAFTS